MARYIDAEHLFKCETCRHHRSGGCDTWCENGECYSPDMSKIPTAEVVGIDDGFEIVIMSAVRYAIGRQTYVPLSVIQFISPILGKLSGKTLAVLEKDITEANSYGDEKIDKPEWMNFLNNIRKERDRR